MKDIKINLLALTGFGNIALKSLTEEGVSVIKVYTRKESAEFPYYKEEQLVDLARSCSIPVEFVPLKGAWTINGDVDINICATFHRILDMQHLKRAKLNINIHPSLLPSYKGPTPTNWMIHNKERICGITAHYLTNRIDEGEIIFQREYPLICETDPELRKFLAKKTGDVVKFIIAEYPNYRNIESHYKESSYGNYWNERGVK